MESFPFLFSALLTLFAVFPNLLYMIPIRFRAITGTAAAAAAASIIFVFYFSSTSWIFFPRSAYHVIIQCRISKPQFVLNCV